MVQLVKNPPAMRVDLGWKDSPGKGNNDLFQYSGLGNSGPWSYTVHGAANNRTRLGDFHFSWASLVAQLVMNPPAMQETWVRSLGWEDTLEKGKATHFSILA